MTAVKKAQPILLADAARALGLAPSTLRAQVANGRIGAWKIGPLWMTTQAEVDRYQAENRGKPGRPSGARKGAHL